MTDTPQDDERILEEELKAAGIVLTKQLFSQVTGWQITGMVPDDNVDEERYLLVGSGNTRLNALQAVKVKAVATYGSSFLVGE
jgi:hypothetical protein